MNMNMPEKNKMVKKWLNISDCCIERYMHYLTFELEDYSSDDQKIINQFWLGFLLGYVKNNPIESILGVVVRDYFENTDLLPDKIMLEEIKKCKVYDDTIYRLKFFIVKGVSFIKEYFIRRPYIIKLNSDGSERIASTSDDSEHLTIYLHEDKINELKNYLNINNLNQPNRLRDALVRFYSFFNLNIPTVNSFIEMNHEKVNISDLKNLQNFINLLKCESGKMIYFWAKDLLDDGEASDFLKKHTGLFHVDAQSISKLLAYIFSLKFESIKELVDREAEKQFSHEVTLPLFLKIMNRTFAYNSCPGFSMNIFLNHHKSTFLGKKVKNKLKKQFKIFNSSIKQKKVHYNDNLTCLFSNVNQYKLKSGRFYLDFPIKMGDLLKNIYNQHVHIQQNVLINNLSKELFTKTGNTPCGVIIRMSNPFLRLEFDCLSYGLTFQEILRNQKVRIYMPYRIQMDINKNKKIISSGILKLNLQLVVHEELLNKSIVHFLYPENINLIADINVHFDDGNEEYSKPDMHLLLKPNNIQNTINFFDNSDED